MLLARNRETNQWMTIGGAVDPGETPAQAAVRECLEETGLTVETIRLVGVFGGPDFIFTYANGDQVAPVVTMFEVGLLGGSLRPDGIEVAELRYVSGEEAAKLDMSLASRTLIARAFERRTEPYFDPA